MEFLSNKPLLITDTILRDAHQSQAATRMTTADIWILHRWISVKIHVVKFVSLWRKWALIQPLPATNTALDKMKLTSPATIR